MSRFERDWMELGWWVAMHGVVEDQLALLRSAARMARWWKGF